MEGSCFDATSVGLIFGATVRHEEQRRLWAVAVEGSGSKVSSRSSVPAAASRKAIGGLAGDSPRQHRQQRKRASPLIKSSDQVL
jgi:hypothetical protein